MSHCMRFVQQVSLHPDNDEAAQQLEPQRSTSLSWRRQKRNFSIVKIAIVFFTVGMKKAEALKQVAETQTSQKSGASAGFRVQD